MKIIDKIKKDFSKTPDLTIRSFKLSFFRKIDVVFLETVCSSNKVNEYVLKNLVDINNEIKLCSSIDNYFAGPNTLKIKETDINFYLTNGFTLIIDGLNIYAVETRTDIYRNISTPEVQIAINGPKDAFTENYQVNIGLIKKRLKTNQLKTENLFLGRKTKTTVGVLYIDDIVDKKLVHKVIKKLKNIDVDGILDSSQLAHLLSGESRSLFPTIKPVERPDLASHSLLEGKIVLVVDNSTFALTTPSFFLDYFHPFSDVYIKGMNANFGKMLRILAFLITIFAPGVYIAMVNYNQETIPTKLLLNIISQRNNVPFPSALEAFMMLFICEILRESDLRFPSSFGSSISILGTLILGEAAVSAGIVSPIMIIIVALTFITSLAFTDINMISATRYHRFFALFLASLLGVIGIMISFVFLIIKLTSTYSMGKPYTVPLAPFDKAQFNSLFIKKDDKTEIERSKILVKNNIRKRG